MNLYFIDAFLTVLHFAIIGFNLFGWIPVRWRKAHFISILLTAASWFVLGIWYGIGFCPITEWQWQVKEELGERNLPASFITYYAEKALGKPVDSAAINLITIVCFVLAVLLCIYFNFLRKTKPPQKKLS